MSIYTYKTKTFNYIYEICTHTNLHTMNKKKLFFATTLIVVIAVCVYYTTSSKTVALKDCGTCKTTDEAFAETQKALNIISTHLNSGIKSAIYLKEYENTKNKIFKK